MTQYKYRKEALAVLQHTLSKFCGQQSANSFLLGGYVGCDLRDTIRQEGYQLSRRKCVSTSVLRETNQQCLERAQSSSLQGFQVMDRQVNLWRR